MIVDVLVSLIVIPLVSAVLVFFLPKSIRGFCALLGCIFNFFIASSVFNKEILLVAPWAGFGMDFSLRLYHFSGFIVLAASFFGALITLYSLAFLKDRTRLFYAYLLLSLAFTNGAVLANNLVVLLFFWEGLLVTLYGLIAIGRKGSFRTATKAFIIVGVSDLCMMAGIILTGYLAKTLVISQIRLSPDSLGGIAFVLLVIGAVAKAGAMPFHTWIPDAALDAPLPFMALFPASLEKLLGIYFLSRVTLDMFALSPHSQLSTVLMILGALTILLAVMMALIQKDYKRLLSYHAISQVGYMVLGIGTCLPAGIIGGIFHMINHALYKCGLFLTSGAVEKSCGTTKLEKLGSLRSSMPVTFFCFLVTAASISGVPPFNGFFSKELIYDAALERGAVFYCAAITGSFLTAASFLKLGHAAYFGNPRHEYKGVKEAPPAMLIPMVLIAATCIFFGIFNHVPINTFIRPVLGTRFLDHKFAGWPSNPLLVAVTVMVILAACIHHYAAFRITGSGLKVSDHIHHAPLLRRVYRWAEQNYFDPYEWGRWLIAKGAYLLWKVDRLVDWLYDSLIVNVSFGFSKAIRRAHSGYYVVYVIWVLVGACACLIYLF